MAESSVLKNDPSEASPPEAAPSSAEGEPLLARLNERGFRLVMLADAVGLLAVTLVAMFVRFGTQWPNYPVWLYLFSFAVTVLIFTATLYFGGMYEREPRLGAPPALPRAVRQTMAAGGLVALMTLGLSGFARELGWTTERALPFPVINLVALIVIGAVVVAGNRQLAHLLRTRREGPPKVVLIGTADDLGTAAHHVRLEDHQARVMAELEDASQLCRAVESTGATDVLLLDGRLLDDLFPDNLEVLDRAGVTVLLRVTARETMFGLERVREVGGLPFVLLRSQTMPRSRARFKRFFDVAVLTGTFPIWGLLLLLVVVYQLFAAGRPLFYWQERVGEGGVPFMLVKFRTMRPDAEADGHGARLAAREDPRIIAACRWLRDTRLDELPQVLNVLRGEMSLVGPRPERPELTEDHEREIPGYTRRYEIPPGVTGLAQIHGRYHTDAEFKLGYDLQYLVNWSPVLDLEILARTVRVVLTRRV